MKNIGFSKLATVLLCLLSGSFLSWTTGVTTRVEAAVTEGVCHEVKDKPLYSTAALLRFYADRDCRRAWSTTSDILPVAETLIHTLLHAEDAGLRPTDYHLRRILTLQEEIRKLPAAEPDLLARDLTELDILLSDAFFLYAAHLTQGRVNPETIDPDWHIAGREKDLALLLQTALSRGHLEETLRELAPPHQGYRLLQETLAQMRAAAAAGGWPLVPWGPALREGDRGPRVEVLRRRLVATADLAGDFRDGELFDAVLADAVRRFQKRHALETDAVAGKRTLAALNTPATLRARQIEANLERWRWLPRDLGRRHILVNIPDFLLTVVEDGAPVMEMRVIAGRQTRRTPFFTGAIASIILNPSWIVPEIILIEDKLPLILDNRDFLRDQHFRVFQVRNARWIEVNAGEIAWATLDPGRFPYRLRQDPGPWNALGRIKFQIPNKYDVYLHDTPSRELFASAERTFSSGCIRVEKALALAEYLLHADPTWTRERIEAAIQRGRTMTLSLAEPMTVYLLYWTSWVDQDGTLQFREDVYERDEILVEALRRPLAAP